MAKNSFKSIDPNKVSRSFRELNPELFHVSSQTPFFDPKPSNPISSSAEPKERKRRSRQEEEYEAILKRQFPEHEILYERYTLKLAEGLRYTPDFCVIDQAGGMCFHEVKGRYLFKGASKSLTDASLSKPKAAAEIFRHHRFFVAMKIEGEWRVKECFAAD